MPDRLRCTIERVDDAAVLDITGDVTFANAPALQRALNDLLDEGARRLVIDVSQVEFMDSSGLSALLSGRAAAGASGARLAVVHAEGRPPGVLRFKGVEQLIDLYERRDDALGA